MEKNSIFIICPICKKQLSTLSTKHLKTHSTTVKKIKELYPEVIIHSDVYWKKKKELDKSYREKNKNELNEYFSLYRKTNKDKRNTYQKNYHSKNKETIKTRRKSYDELNKENKKLYVEKYRKENKDKIKVYHEKYRKENKDKKSLSAKKYNVKNPHIASWRRILQNSLRDLGNKKTDKTIKLLGYSALEFKNHISSLFTDGMSWDNYGDWHIDHIKQIISFDKNTHPSIVNALSNLRPLWSTTREINGIIYEGNLNRKKYNKFIKNKILYL